MGWFGLGAKPPPVDVTHREARERCHAARDAWDAAGGRASGKERRALEEACPVSWVRHFERKRAQRASVAQLVERTAPGPGPNPNKFADATPP